MIYEGLLAGILAGALRSIMGWLESEEKFDPKKFVTTLIRTCVIGASLGFASAESPVTVFFITYTSDTLIKQSYNVAKSKVEGDKQ